jgi:hypothetical protein
MIDTDEEAKRSFDESFLDVAVAEKEEGERIEEEEEVEEGEGVEQEVEPLPFVACFNQWVTGLETAAYIARLISGTAEGSETSNSCETSAPDSGGSDSHEIGGSLSLLWAVSLGMDAQDPDILSSTSWREHESKASSAKELAANVRREQEMARRLRALCSGELTGGRKKRAVVAVVGRGHVHPLRNLLQQAAP